MDQLEVWHRVYQLFEFCEGGIVLSLCLGKVKLCSQIVQCLFVSYNIKKAYNYQNTNEVSTLFDNLFNLLVCEMQFSNQVVILFLKHSCSACKFRLVK